MRENISRESIKLTEKHLPMLMSLFNEISNSGDFKLFHPHSFEYNQAYKICNYKGRDIYIANIVENQIMAYGMLRGWDDGYDVPSLGIYVRKEARGSGIATWFMNELHDTAKKNGADKIRLTVEKDNYKAIELYKSLGYILKETENNLLGYLEL